MKRKIFNILVALAVVLGLSLIPAIAMGTVADSYAAYRLGDGTSGTAEWSVTQKYSGAYSAKLTKAAGTYDSTYVDFVPSEVVTLADFGLADGTGTKEFSWWHYTSAGISNHSQMELRFTAPDGDADIVLDITAMPLQNYNGTAAWVEKSLVQGTTGLLYYGTNAADVDYSWTTGTGHDDLLKTVAGIITAIKANESADADAVLDALVLTRVRIELWDADATKTSYIDDVTIAGTTYDLEPMVLDAAYYKTGGTVNVSVYNGYATGTIFGYAYSDSIDPSLPITYALTDGDSDGVFTGSFDLVGTVVANKLVVNEGDTIYVKCTADWGAGAQTLAWGPTAIIDDTVPEIEIVSPAVSANTTDNTTDIAVALTDDVSGIDEATIVMTLDGEEVVAAYDAGALTYTSEALDEGSYTITVDVSDIAGNAAEQASWSFTVDTIAPVVTDQLATPVVILPDDETEVVFTATVTDATSGVYTVTIDLTDVGGDVIDMLDDGEGDDAVADDGIYTATANITEADEADYTLTVTATDYAGNHDDTEDVALGIWSDIVPPEISDAAIEYPFGLSSAMRGDAVIISATVTDDVLMGTVIATCDAFADVTMVDDGTGVDEVAGDDIYTGEATVAADATQDAHIVTITATDAKGNAVTDETQELNVIAGVTGYDLDLVEGWNLISLPIIPGDADITIIISADNLASDNISHVGIIRAYDPATGLFPYYIPETADSELTEMVDGYGYWVFMNADDTLTITGRELPAPPAIPPTYDVVVGWNLIGFKSLDAMIDNHLTTDEGYLLNIEGTYPVLWSYDAAAGAYSNVKGVDHGMTVGHGFWIWVTVAGTIVPPGPVPD